MNNKFSKIIEDEYKSGSLNLFFYNKLLKKSIDDDVYFDHLMSKYKAFTKLGADSNNKLRLATRIERHMIDLCGKCDFEIVKNILSKEYSLNSSNDFYYAILKESYKKSKLKKTAYPNISLEGRGVGEPFDLNKWIDVVHNIYESVNNNQMSINNAVDYYSNSLDIKRNEDVKFKKWLKYYSSGEHLKYSEENKEGKMKKQSVFMSGLSPSNPNYYHDKANNMPGDSIAGEVLRMKNSPRKPPSDGDGFLSWRSKLHTACRRIDKLLRLKCPPDTYRELAQTLFNLSVQISELQPRTASDVTHRTANKLKRLGFVKEANILTRVAEEGDDLIKVAQDAAPPDLEEAPPQPPPDQAQQPGAEAGPTPGPEGVEAQPPEQEEEKKSPIPSPDDVEPAKLEDIEPIPGPQVGEYDKLAGDLTLSDASEKLDQVAGMLADRRVIRHLAEFDIMLDKLGIASMFPELAESQSKLIDAYSYGLTRVTKMMGQLSNAEALLMSQTGIPGVSDDDAEVAEEGPPEVAEEGPPELEVGPPQQPEQV